MEVRFYARFLFRRGAFCSILYAISEENVFGARQFMNEESGLNAVDDAASEETLSRTELQIEQEKLKLERERILLERERLEAMRDRVRMESGLHVDGKGKPAVAFSTLALVSIICLLVGGILGALSMSVQRDRRSAERLQKVMQTLASAAPEDLEGALTNEAVSVSADAPSWLKTMKPRGAHAGISLVVVQ